MTLIDFMEHKYIKTIEQTSEFNSYLSELTFDQMKVPKLTTSNNPYLNNVEQINHDLWINADDFTDRTDNLENDNIMVDIQVMSLFDEILYIINEQVIEKEELDENFKKYLKCASNAVQVCMNNMFESKWNFNPMEKFMWIYLMLASKYEHRAIKYLEDSPYYTQKLYLTKDKYGYSPFFHILLDQNFDIAYLHPLLTIENLNSLYFNNQPLINYTIMNNSTIIYIINNVPGLFNLDYATHNSPFMMACIYNGFIAQALLDHNLVTREIINNKSSNGVNCLMYALIHNPDIFKQIFESISLCDQEIVDYTHSHYGNILTIAFKYQPNLVNYILDSQYISTALLNGKISYKHNIKTNILIECANDTELFNKIINHTQFDINILYNLGNNIPILHEIALRNLEAFRMLYVKNYITTEKIIDDSHEYISLLFYAALYNLNLLEILIGLDTQAYNTEYLEFTYKQSGKNIIMILLEKTNDDKKNFISKLYDAGFITSEILKKSDAGQYNTFWYICIYFPEFAIQIINKTKKSISIFLPYNIFKSLCYQLSKKNPELLETIFSLDIINVSYINHIDSYSNNLFMETCIFDNLLTEKLCDKKLIDLHTLSQGNNNNDNALILLLKYSTLPFSVLSELLKKIIYSEHMNPEILNNKNITGEFPFLIACQLNYCCMELILNSPHFDMSSFSSNTFNGDNCFVYACKSRDYNLITTLCDHQLFSETMFTSYDKTGVPHIYNALISDSETIKYVLNHKYCTTQLLNDSYKTLITKNNLIVDIFALILKSNMCTTETLKIKNTDGNNCLSIAILENNIKVIKDIIKSIHFTKDILLSTNIFDENCLYLITDNEILSLILNCDKFDHSMFLIKSKNNISPLHKFITSKNYSLLYTILESKKYPIELLQYNDVLGTGSCIISKLFTFPDNIVSSVFNNDSLTEQDLCASDVKGNTCLHTYSISLHEEFIKRNDALTPEMLEIDFGDSLKNLEKYLNSNKSSVKLFEAINNDGNTFLQLNPYLLNIALNSKYCTKKLLKNNNNEGTMLFMNLYLYYKSHLGFLINHSLFDSSFYTDTIKNKQNMNMISYICINSLDDTINQILKSSACTNEIINYVSDVNYTPIMYAIATGNIFAVEKLLNSEFDLTPSFKHKGYDLRNLLMLSVLINNNIFNIIFNSKYVTEEMFLECDKYKHNVVIYALNRNVDIVKTIIESKYWNEQLMYYTDVDSDFLMMYPYDKPDIVKYLLESNKCKPDMLLMKNNIGKNCSHYYAKYNAKSFDILLSSNVCTDEVILQQDNYGNTCLQIACIHNIESVDKLLKSNYITEDLIFLQNKNGLNAIMLSLEYNPSIALSLYLQFDANKDLLYQQDNEGNNLIFYAIRYNLKLLRKILKSPVCDKNLLSVRNNDNFTCYMYASYHNGAAMKFLMRHNETCNDMLYSGHMDYGSCLTLAARYQPLAIKYMLEWNKLSWNVLNTISDKNNFLSLACTYNTESVKHSLQSPVDLTELFYGRSTDPAFLNACRYQPEAVKYILESKYGNTKMILEKINGRTCVDEAYDLQPKSLLYLLQSKHGGNQLLNIEDERGYKLIHRIRKTFPEIITINDIAAINLTQYQSDIANSSEKKCDICYTFKQVVLLLPCYHMCCIGCAFKLSKCHQCRTIINNRKVL